MSHKDKTKLDEAKISAEAIEQMKLGVAIDSAYIRGARSGFEQSRAEIEALELKVRQLESNRTSYIKGLLFEIESKDKRIAELEALTAYQSDRFDKVIEENEKLGLRVDSANAKLERVKEALRKCHMEIGDDVYEHATKCDVVSRDALFEIEGAE